jgi:hypothetical protein
LNGKLIDSIDYNTNGLKWIELKTNEKRDNRRPAYSRRERGSRNEGQGQGYRTHAGRRTRSTAHRGIDGGMVHFHVNNSKQI